MTDSKKPDYQVGYGRPPIDKRFQKGTSGNSSGRAKGLKSVGKIISETMGRRVTVQENGKSRNMSMQDVIIQGLVNDAARRDPKALRLLFSLIDRYGDGRDQEIDTMALSSDDEAIINRYIASTLENPQANANGCSASQNTVEDNNQPSTKSASHKKDDSNGAP